MRKRTALWVLLAVLGLAVAAGVTAVASSLSTQHVGLSSEPLSAGERLAPATTSGQSSRKPAAKPARPSRPTSGESSDDGGGRGDD